MPPEILEATASPAEFRESLADEGDDLGRFRLGLLGEVQQLLDERPAMHGGCSAASGANLALIKSGQRTLADVLEFLTTRS